MLLSVEPHYHSHHLYSQLNSLSLTLLILSKIQQHNSLAHQCVSPARFQCQSRQGP